MKPIKLIIIFFTIILSSLAFSQEVLFEDNFKENDGSWAGSSKYVMEYKDGDLILHGYLRKDVEYVLRDIYLDPAKDFTINCRIKYADGHTKKSYGLILVDSRFTGKTQIVGFKLYPKDAYEITKINTSTSGTRYILPRKEKTGLVKGQGEYNDLELRNSNGVLEYYINGSKVWSSASLDICISMIGFMNEGYQNVKVDYISVKQDGWHNIDLVDDEGKIFTKENLGENINSAADELAPIISADGKTLYLTVEGDKENIGTEDNQDIWYSALNPDGTWSKRINIGKPLNNESGNSVFYVTPDNNSLFVINRYDKSGNSIGAGISVSDRKKGGWNVPVTMDVEDYYNDNKYCSHTFSPSGKTMIMSVERKDSFGKKDLYVSFKKDDGTWTAPLNIGEDVNTFGDEGTPFLAADNSTLYFTANARPGYGEYDIFITRRLDDTWTNWSEPKNLGPNINTPGWDAYFTIPASGDYSYLVSTDNSYGDGDIFSVKVAEAAKPIPVALIKGQVFNPKTKEFLEASITYFDLETNQEIGIARSNPENGNYQISLPSGKKYSYFAQKENFFSVSENIDLTGLEEYTEVTRDLYLAPIDTGTTIRLNNIFFDTDKSVLLETSVFELERLLSIMNDNPQLIIELAGHTDNVGTVAYNQKLSEDRARAVYDYLGNKNVALTRISYVGYGESMPVATNDTEEGRQLNRRVVFKIVSK